MRVLNLIMCKLMFITSGLNVYILQLVHIFYIVPVAKKVTLLRKPHTSYTRNPQSKFNSSIAVTYHPVINLFNTLSTNTTTTTFNISNTKNINQKKYSLTFGLINIYN